MNMMNNNMTIISSEEISVGTSLEFQKNCGCKDEKMDNMKPFKTHKYTLRKEER